MRNKLPNSERSKLWELAKPTLWTAQGEEALKYLLQKRKFSEQAVKRYGLGYVPEFVKTKTGDRHEFAGRLVIPILDQYGQLVALSSRDFRPDAYMPFFHESFVKGHYLYGLNVAKKYIFAKRKVVLVEGEFDVIALASRGLKCVVGVLGSALQLYQLSLLARYCDDIFVVFDGDKAGEKAERRSSLLCTLNRFHDLLDINIIPVSLPNGKDPDDIVKESGVKTFIDILRNARMEIGTMRGDS